VSVAAHPPAEAAPDVKEPGRWRQHAVTAAFLAPAALMLIVWIVYPTVYTAWRSLYDREGTDFIGLHNYKTLFTTDILVTAIRNNAIWIAVVPAFVTSIGLIFGVLTEKISWSVAFKTAVFMPMAISLFAAGVIWRIMDQKEPERGTVNAMIGVVVDAAKPPGPLPAAFPATPGLTGSVQQGYTLRRPVPTGGSALLPLTGIPPDDVPVGATQAATPQRQAGAVTGVVWRDFKPGGGTVGKVEPGELGLPGVTLELLDSSGKQVGSTSSADDGSFAFGSLEAGAYRVKIGAQTFKEPFAGIDWLGPKLITPAAMFAYIWVWAGFAMVVIAAGLAAIPRDTLEAARTDGATEWQVFRRVTVPLLWPVITVVLITMLINVLKVFDIILSVAPGSVQDDANVIALAMWRTSFGGVNDFGLGSAIAVFLFLLVIPILALNVRRFRNEAS
jgi:alpha-glucoside transport system permease protein